MTLTLSLLPRCPIFHVDKTDDDSSVQGDGGDWEGRDDDEDGLERGLEVAQEGGVAPVPSLVHHLHLDKHKANTTYYTVLNQYIVFGTTNL